MKYNRFLPLIVPAIVLVFLELFYFRPSLIYIIIILVFLLFFFAIRQIKTEAKEKGSIFNFLIFPSTFFLGSTIFSMILPNGWLVQLIFALNIFLIYYYFRTIYLYLIKTDYYQKYTLESIASYGNFLSYYFLASSVYGLRVFIGAPIWLLMLFTVIITALIVYQVMWVNKIDMRRGGVYLLLITLVLLQIAWSASFLTLSFYILGLILAVCYYIVIGLVRFYLIDKLTKKLIKLYLIFGFSSIATVLFTANWIFHS